MSAHTALASEAASLVIPSAGLDASTTLATKQDEDEDDRAAERVPLPHDAADLVVFPLTCR